MSPSLDWQIHDDKPQNTVDDETQASQYQGFDTQQVQPIIDYNRFSKYERLLRTMAFVKAAFQPKKTRYVTFNLSSELLQWSEEFLIKLVQNHNYSFEISILEANPNCILPKTSPLRKLLPFLDRATRKLCNYS